LLNPDYKLLARSFGAEGFSASKPENLKQTICDMLDCDGPALIDVKIATSELTMPPRIGATQAFGFARAKIKEFLG